MLRGVLEALLTPGNHHVERLVPLGQCDVRFQLGRQPVGLGPASGDGGRSVVCVVDRQVEVLMAQPEGRRAGVFGHLQTAPQRRHDVDASVLSGDQVGPPDIGQAQVVDVGIGSRNNQVAGQNRPIVPALVPTPVASKVGSVQRRGGPPDGVRVQVGAAGVQPGAGWPRQIDRIGQPPLVRWGRRHSPRR